MRKSLYIFAATAALMTSGTSVISPFDSPRSIRRTAKRNNSSSAQKARVVRTKKRRHANRFNKNYKPKMSTK